MPGLQVPIVLEADHCQELGMVSQWAWAVFSWWEDFRGGSGTRVPASWSEVSGSVWLYPTGSNQSFSFSESF